MKKIILILLLITAMTLTACGSWTSSSGSQVGSHGSQVGSHGSQVGSHGSQIGSHGSQDKSAMKMLFSESLPEVLSDGSPNNQNPTSLKKQRINHAYMKGVWLAYNDYPELLSGDFTENIISYFKTAKGRGINTVFVHVSAHNDAFYNSKLFKKAYTGDFDMLEIMLAEGHKLGLSVHAWINPLRTEDSWLDPNKEDTVNSVRDKVHEIVSNYAVDGIHIDDYIYPVIENDTHTAEQKFSAINTLVQTIRDMVKEFDKNIIFSISPAGNIGNNLTKNFADVQYWFDNNFADIIIPQLYYGFENQFLPFDKSLSQWLDMAKGSSVRLAVGLAEYKQGKTDTNAGTGANEWIEKTDIIKRQIELIEKNNAISGYALF
jgi:uncharacterized lipoprotein YddW (UPF0748 family)/predicted small secreted protein